MFGWFDEYTYFGNEDRESGKRLYPNMTKFEDWAKTWKPPPASK
jgi:hypothetical protein